MLVRMISELTTSGAPVRSGFLSRLERMTSTRSLGRMKPPAPVSGEISVETARMPVGRIAAMKPEPSAFTSFGSRIGSPAMKGARAIEPTISVVASGRSLRRMKVLLAVAAGQVCHCMSSGLTDLAEADVGLRDQDVDGLQLRDRLGRRGLVVGPAREICGNAAGTESDGQDDNACGIHTLHFPHYAATLPPP